jgi:hypothetical protein
MMVFKLYAEYEVHMENFIGTFKDMKEAGKKVVELENQEEYIGAELVLINDETGTEYFYTDGEWERLDGDEDEEE